MRRMIGLTVGLMLVLTVAYAPEASATQLDGAFSITGTFEWVIADGTVALLSNAVAAINFETTAGSLTSDPGAFKVEGASGDFLTLAGLTTGLIKDFTFNNLGVPINVDYPVPVIPDFQVIEGFHVDLLSILDSATTTTCPDSNPGVCDSSTLTNISTLHLEGTIQIRQDGNPDITLGFFVLNLNASGGTFSFSATDTAVPSAVPEPATLLLLGSGLVAAGVFARKRR